MIDKVSIFSFFLTLFCLGVCLTSYRNNFIINHHGLLFSAVDSTGLVDKSSTNRFVGNLMDNLIGVPCYEDSCC